jgi:hypothetical protein
MTANERAKQLIEAKMQAAGMSRAQAAKAVFAANPALRVEMFEEAKARREIAALTRERDGLRRQVVRQRIRQARNQPRHPAA